MAWCWHRWTKWQDIYNTELRFVQHRECRKCGMKRGRTVWTYLGSNEK